MSDILTSIGVDDRAARTALKDYARYASDRARDMDASLGRFGMSLAKRFLGVTAVLKGMQSGVQSVREFAKTSDVASGALDRLDMAADRVQHNLGRELARSVSAAEGPLRAVLGLGDLIVKKYGELTDAVGDSIQGKRGDGWAAQKKALEDYDLALQQSGREFREVSHEHQADRARIMAEQVAMSTDQHEREMAIEEEKHRLAAKSIQLKYQDIKLQDDLIEREEFRHYLAVQKIDREEKDRQSKARLERDLVSLGPVAARAAAAGRMAGLSGDPEAVLAADRAALEAQYNRDRLAVTGDPGIKTLEREARVAALEEEYSVSQAALTQEYAANRTKALRDTERAVQMERMQLEIDAKRLAGFEAEADVREAIMGFEQRIGEIRRDRSISESERQRLEGDLRASQGSYLGAFTGKQAREAALDDFQGARAVVTGGGTAGFGSGSDTRRLAIGGVQGGRQTDEHQRKQTLSQERLVEMVNEIRQSIGRLDGAVYR